MSKLLFVLVASLLVCVATAGLSRHDHHHPPASKHKQCHFQTEKASYDLRLLVREMHQQDWSLIDEKTRSTFSFNPCGGVHNPVCPQGSALCEVTEKGIAINFGNAEEMTWAESATGVELTFANGEPCDNGVPRKTLVQMTCSQPTNDKATQASVITDIALDSCLVVLRIKSPYACPIEQLCTVFDQAQCKDSEDLCVWSNSNGTCSISASPCLQFGRHHLSVAALVGIFASLGILFFCVLSLCLCACCIKRRRARAGLPTVHKRTPKKATKKAPKKKSPVVREADAIPMTEMPAPQYIYQPVPMTFAGMPYAQFNPYSLPNKDYPAPQFVQYIPQNTAIQHE